MRPSISSFFGGSIIWSAMWGLYLDSSKCECFAGRS
jgi:hypothetical protein